MDCEKALILISAALDGELTEAERQALAAHLEECPECRALSEDFGVLSVALSDMEVAPPEELTEQLSAALDVLSPAAAPKPNFWRRWGGLCAMLAVVVCAGGLYWVATSGMLAGGSGSAPTAAADSAGAEAVPREGTEESAAATESQSNAALFAAQAEPEAPQVAEDAAGGDDHTAEEPAPGEDDPDGQLRAPAEGPESVGEKEEPAATMEPATNDAPQSESLTPDQGLELVFAHMGGLDAYPDAVHAENEPYTYRLEHGMKGEVSSQHLLSYEGLSPNGRYLIFRQYDYQMRSGADGWAYAITGNHFAVAVDGTALLSEYDATLSPEHTNAYYEAIRTMDEGEGETGSESAPPAS